MSIALSNVRGSVRSIGVRSYTVSCWTDMGKSKFDFVQFVKAAASDPSSVEASEMNKYLVKCFVDNDSDYDGLVSKKGMNNMIHDAALPPRRFGFAPHTREMYNSLEEFETERDALFTKLCDGGQRITLSSWLAWSNEHIMGKASGLVPQTESRWERSEADFLAFYQGVASESSSNCKRSSSSTQYKEFYMLSLGQFCAADSDNVGSLNESQFNGLVEAAAKIPGRFGHNWYANVSFSSVAVGGKVTWDGWFAYNRDLVVSAVAAQASSGQKMSA